jgi:hypothetical protein
VIINTRMTEGIRLFQCAAASIHEIPRFVFGGAAGLHVCDVGGSSTSIGRSCCAHLPCSPFQHARRDSLRLLNDIGDYRLIRQRFAPIPRDGR